MISFLIWLPLATSLLFLLGVVARISSKSSSLNKQLERTDRYLANYESRVVEVDNRKLTNSIPAINQAVSDRKDYLKKRSKKRADKQRRLVSRLKSRS